MSRTWTRFVWATKDYGHHAAIEDATMQSVIAQEMDFERRGLSRIAENNLYTVDVNVGEAAPCQGEFVYLSIRRKERSRLPRDWRDLQRIKAEIVGPEHEGFELFPAESRLVDSADQFHLWVLPKPLRRTEEGELHDCIPVGYSNRYVATKEETTAHLGESKSTQRPFEFTLEDFHAPLLTPEQIAKGDLR